MKIRVQLFAGLKDFYESELSLDLPEPARAGDVHARLGEINPGGRELLKVSRLAIDDSFVSADSLLREGQEVIVLPPSSGG